MTETGHALAWAGAQSTCQAFGQSGERFEPGYISPINRKASLILEVIA